MKILHVVSFSGYITDHLSVLKEGIEDVRVLCFPILPFHISDVVNTSKVWEILQVPYASKDGQLCNSPKRSLVFA